MRDQSREDFPGRTALDATSEKFLLQEYEHLVASEGLTINNYGRWYSIFLTAFAAAMTIAIPIVQVFTSTAQQVIMGSIFLGLLLFGIATFANLSAENAIYIHKVRARITIQDYFVQRDPKLEDYLYYRTTSTGITGTGIRATITRGLVEGGPRTVLLLIDSILVGLIAAIISEVLWSITPVLQFAVGMITFFLSTALHVIYAWIIYKANRIHRPLEQRNPQIANPTRDFGDGTA